MKIEGNQIKIGNILEVNNKLWRVTKTQHTQPGKGGAYLQVEMKALKEGTKTNERFRSSESVERVILDEKKYQFNTYHTFVIQTKRRNELIKFLKRKGIGTAVHYPIPIHLQPAAKYLGYKKGSFPAAEKQSSSILTLPVHQNLKKNNLEKIVNYLNKF